MLSEGRHAVRTALLNPTILIQYLPHCSTHIGELVPQHDIQYTGFVMQVRLKLEAYDLEKTSCCP
jgi:hypothetical protein